MQHFSERAGAPKIVPAGLTPIIQNVFRRRNRKAEISDSLIG